MPRQTTAERDQVITVKRTRINIIRHNRRYIEDLMVEEIIGYDTQHAEYTINFISNTNESLSGQVIEVEWRTRRDEPRECTIRILKDHEIISQQVHSIDIQNPVNRDCGWPFLRSTRYSGEGFFAQEYACAFGRKKQKYPKMKCAFCNDKIHSPDYLRKLLGPQQTKKYLEFCKKVGTKPTLYCCRCYKTIKENPKIFEAFNKMIRQYKIWKKDYESENK